MSGGLSAHCVAGVELTGEPTGAFHDGAYFHPAPPPALTLTSDSQPVTSATTAKPKCAIVLLTDVFGLYLKNPKLLADKYSERLECDVWVPDMFNGKPNFPPGSILENWPQTPGAKVSWSMRLRSYWVIITSLPGKFANRPAIIDRRMQAFIAKIKSEKGYEKIGVVGFCIGGSTAIRLASKNLISSAVICHPFLFTIAQIKAISVPTSWACAEEDEWFRSKTRDKAEAAFAVKKGKPEFVEYEFRVYEGTVHGFALRPDLSVPELKKAFEESFEQAVGWFTKTLL